MKKVSCSFIFFAVLGVYLSQQVPLQPVQVCSYPVTLKSINGTIQSKAIVRSNYITKVIAAKIPTMFPYAAGGVTLMDFPNKLLAIKSTNGSGCGVLPFPSDANYFQVQQVLSSPPQPNGAVRNVLCDVSPFDSSSLTEEARKKFDCFCGSEKAEERISVTNCRAYSENEPAQTKFNFCTISVIIDENGFGCIRGGDFVY